jgi:hypothetical protein
MSSIILSPIYRTIKNYTIQTGAGTDTIELLGTYKKGKEFETISSNFKSSISGKIASENITILMEISKDMSPAVQVKSEELLNPYVIKAVGIIIDGMSNTSQYMDDIEKKRNNLIKILDKLNFIIETSGRDGKKIKNEHIGANLSGYTYDELYPKYNNVISFIKENHIKFTEDLDTSYDFEDVTMTTEELSYFLSILLRSKKKEILDLYGKDTTIFTPRILKDIEKRLDKFLSVAPTSKDFKIKKYPIRKDNKTVSFVISDELFTFSDSQIVKLDNTLRTSGNKTTSVLNYYR